MINRRLFSAQAFAAIEIAQHECQVAQRYYLENEHLLLGVLVEGGIPLQAMRRFKVDASRIRQEFQVLELELEVEHCSGPWEYSADVLRTLELAQQTARCFSSATIGIEHLFLSMFGNAGSRVCRVLIGAGLNLEALQEEVLTLINAGSV